jgi:hypothetical protein
MVGSLEFCEYLGEGKICYGEYLVAVLMLRRKRYLRIGVSK